MEDGVLQAMTIAWRELHQPEKICRMYEGAVSKEPLNEEFLSHLFMSYVRMGEYKKQQTVAMNLYKVAKKNPYYYWSVMSLVLQALQGDERLGKTVHLPLALRMLQKMETDQRMEQEQEIMLYCLVMEMKEDWKAALELLQGPLGQKLAKSGGYKTFFNTKSIEWQQASENWSEVARLSREELDRMPDQWLAWTQYITASVKLAKQNNDSSITEEVEAFIKSMQSEHSQSRGPWLAEMELKSAQGPVSCLPDLIVQYFGKFGTKLVTFSDIAKYLDMLNNDQKKAVYDRVNVEQEITDHAGICRDINLCQLSRYCGCHDQLSVEQRLELVETLVRRYQSVQPLVKDMLVTDIRPSDEYLVLVSHLLWDCWKETKDDQYYIRCAVLLSWGLGLSPSNWQLKLMLTRLLTSVGCAGHAHDVYSGLDVKHLMLDSLGWVMSHQLVQAGHWALAHHVHMQTMRLYSGVTKDTSDHMITAYRTGTFYQIRDIYNLKQRILNSYHNMSTTAEYNLCTLLNKASCQAETLWNAGYLELQDDDDWDEKRDNRDLDTMASWDSAFSRDSSWRQSSLRGELLYSRTRQLIVKCVHVCVQMSSSNVSNNQTNGHNVSETSSLSSSLDKLQSHWQQVSQEPDTVSPNTPQSPSSPNIASYLTSHQVETVVTLCTIVNKMVSSEHVDIGETGDMVTQLNKCLDKLSEAVRSYSLQLSRRRELLESIVWMMETLGLVCVLAGSMVAIMKGSDAGKEQGKKNKKGKAGVLPQFSQHTQPFNSLLENCSQANAKLEEIVNVKISKV